MSGVLNLQKNQIKKPTKPTGRTIRRPFVGQISESFSRLAPGIGHCSRCIGPNFWPTDWPTEPRSRCSSRFLGEFECNFGNVVQGNSTAFRHVLGFPVPTSSQYLIGRLGLPAFLKSNSSCILAISCRAKRIFSSASTSKPRASSPKASSSSSEKSSKRVLSHFAGFIRFTLPFPHRLFRVASEGTSEVGHLSAKNSEQYAVYSTQSPSLRCDRSKLSTCFASSITPSNYSIFLFGFHCFQQLGESAFRSKITPGASTSRINARFVYGSAPAYPATGPPHSVRQR